MKRGLTGFSTMLVVAAATTPAMSQSSSLYVRRAPRSVAVAPSPGGMQVVRMSDAPAPSVSASPAGDLALSYFAVPDPTPRKYEVNGLLTIIIREQSSATSESTLETEKELKLDGKISEFPRLRLEDLLNGQLNQSNIESGNEPQVKIGVKNDFEGDGEYERRDTLTTRLQARIVDIKPNGTLALEARTFIQNDDEQLTITVTGYCRAEDITLDNTVLSTQVYDLRVTKTHNGELRKTTQKGILTKVLDAIFNF